MKETTRLCKTVDKKLDELVLLLPEGKTGRELFLIFKYNELSGRWDSISTLVQELDKEIDKLRVRIAEWEKSCS